MTKAAWTRFAAMVLRRDVRTAIAFISPFLVLLGGVLVIVSLAVYGTHGYLTKPNASHAEATSPPEAHKNDNEISTLRRRTENAEAQVRAARTERGVAMKELQSHIDSQKDLQRDWENARQSAERSYAEAARNVNKKYTKDDLWKCHKVIIELFTAHMARGVNNDAEFKRWMIEWEQLVSAIPAMNELFGYGVNPVINHPPSRVMKPFAAYNTEHNRILNLIDYQIERLTEEMQNLEPKETVPK